MGGLLRWWKGKGRPAVICARPARRSRRSGRRLAEAAAVVELAEQVHLRVIPHVGCEGRVIGAGIAQLLHEPADGAAELAATPAIGVEAAELFERDGDT